MSTAMAPAAAAAAFCAPSNMLVRVAIRPSCTRSPARRSSPASTGADGQLTTVPSGPATSVATIRSPGTRPGARPPQVPVTATASAS